jgi:molecular chaperone GrpE
VTDRNPADPRAREGDEERQGPVVNDRRRIDPETGEVRESAKEPAPAAEAPSEGVASESGADAEKTEEDGVLTAQLAERTLDLQRLQAEFANYRKRVARDEQATREKALGNVLADLLPVLDDIGRAREHGELTGGFKQVAEGLEATVAKLGLESFGTPGDPFDPTVHEALMHSYSAEVTEPTAVQILQPGYTVAGRVLRPARVAVAEPDGSAAEGADAEEATAADEDTAGPDAAEANEE